MHLRPIIGGLFLSTTQLLSPLHAQTGQVASPSQTTRAVAVYEWTGDLGHPTAARLIPVSLFIHNHLEDAGVYLSQPIPFALQPGDIYLLQHIGQTLGALELESAHHLLTEDSSNSLPTWYGFGRFLTPAEEAAATTPPSSPNTPTLPTETDSDDAPPALRNHKHDKQKRKTQQQAYVTPPTTPILDDPDRPTLQSGSPFTLTTSELTTLPPDLHQAAAVSDAANRPPQTFTYTRPTATTRDQTLQTLETRALPHLTQYISFNHLTPAPTPTFTPIFTNAQLLAYTLAAGATPTYILTAESPLTTDGPIYLTLIAQPTPTGQLHLALLSITDAAHLDRTPWLRPIDAVDPDATGRADLLFELRSQTTRQFALYSLTTAQPRQVLLTAPIDSPPPAN